MPDSPPVAGLIFSIDRGAVDDGPGLRTTVFSKGCPLRCLWCHSPQSMSAELQLAFYRNRCIECGVCAEVCPRKAQIVSPVERRVVWPQCDHCGKCADVCPARALEMVGEWLTVDQVMDIVKRDLGYYRNSGGGVTFSGGESTMRPRFLIACLKKCKDMGMHTAVDTCGLVKWSVFDQLLPYVDLFLYDIKHMDDKAHRQLTGAGNRLILDNLRKLSRQGTSIWIRLPLIPGYNDSEDHVRSIAEFVKPLKAVEKVSLLPYNSAAGAKYQFIGKRYTLDHVVPPSEEKMMALAAIFSRLGINVELGR